MALINNIVAYWNFDETEPTDFTVENYYLDNTGRGNDLIVQPDQRVQPSTVDFVLGANNSTNSQLLDGSMAQWGKWNRLLTSGEKTALLGGETWPFPATPSLRDAVAYYLLDEASNSATYADATGRGNTLTRSGSITQVTGPGGSGHAAEFVSGGRLILTPVTADLQVGNSPFTVFGWFNMNTKPSGVNESIFWGQIDLASSPHKTGFVAYYQGTSDTVNGDLGDGVDLFANGVLEIAGSSPTVSTWYPVLYEFDPVSSALSGSFNGGSVAVFDRNVFPGVVTGIIGNAAQFSVPPLYAGAGSGWDAQPVVRAAAANDADVSFGDNAKTGWFWFKASDTSATQSLAGFYNFANNDIDWLVQLAGNTLYFLMGNSAGTFQFCDVPFTDTSSFHLIVFWYDKTANTIHLDLDHGASVASLALSTFTPAASSMELFVGSNQDGTPGAGIAGANQQYLGAIDEMGIANGIPLSTDLDTLWNGGAGWTYPNVAISVTSVVPSRSAFGFGSVLPPNILSIVSIIPTRVRFGDGSVGFPAFTLESTAIIPTRVAFGDGSLSASVNSIYIIPSSVAFGKGALIKESYISTFINGLDVSKYVLDGSMQITDSLSQPTTASFSLWVRDQSFVPQVGQQVVIYLAGKRIFGGYIDQPFQTAFQAMPGYAMLGAAGGASGGTSSATGAAASSGSGAIQCTDYSSLLSRRYIGLYFDGNGSPEPSFLTDIVSYIVENFLAADGFTYDSSDGDPGINLGPVLFNWVTIQAAFNTLSSSTGWDFKVDEFQVIRFFATSVSAAPFNVSEGDGNVYAESLGVEYLRSTYRNRQGVVSPSQQGQLWADIFSASQPGPFPNFPQPPDGIRKTFLQLYGFTSIPIVTVNGGPQIVAQLLSAGGFAPMPFDWYIIQPQPGFPSYGLFQNGSHAALGSGDVLEIEYQTPIGTILWLQNNSQIAARAAIEGNTGVYEDVEQAPSTTDPAAIAVYCAGLLARYSDGIPFQVTYSSRTQKPAFSGQSQSIVTANPPLNFTGAISQVTWQDVDGQFMQLGITVQSGKYLGNYTQFFAALVAGTALVPTANTNAYQWGPISTGTQNFQSPQVSVVRAAVESVLFLAINFMPANPAPCQLDFTLLVNGLIVLHTSYPNGGFGLVTNYPAPGSIKMNAGDVITIQVFFSVLFVSIVDATVNLYNVVLSP